MPPPAKKPRVNPIPALFATAKKTFSCQICFGIFDSKLDLQKHFYLKHPDRARVLFPDFVDDTFKCHRCTLPPFRCESELVKHLKKRHAKVVARKVSHELTSIFKGLTSTYPKWFLRCSQCKIPKPFTTPSDLMNHIKIKHMKMVPFHCDPCQLGFMTKLKKDLHDESHQEEDSDQSTSFFPDASTQPMSELFKCPYCEHMDTSEVSVRSHIQLLHGTRPTSNTLCPVCLVGFACPSDLTWHMQEVHHYHHHHQQQQQQQQQQYLYVCNVCGTQTQTAVDFQKHARTFHALTSRLKCPSCNNSYLDQNSLRRHFLKSHPLLDFSNFVHALQVIVS